VIVCPEGDGWTLIRQVDYAADCGRLARAWRERLDEIEGVAL
jgi:hypothetical protein